MKLASNLLNNQRDLKPLILLSPFLDYRCVPVYRVLRTEPRASSVLGKHSTSLTLRFLELHGSPCEGCPWQEGEDAGGTVRPVFVGAKCGEELH